MDRPRYILYVELAKNVATNQNMKQLKKKNFMIHITRPLNSKEMKQLDQRLMKANKSYKKSRSNGRLGSVIIVVVREGTFEKLRSKMIEAGVGPTQAKQPRVTRDECLIQI